MTKEEAEAKLTELPLERAVAVADVPDTGKGARQRFLYVVPGGTCEIEIDAAASAVQLETLANNLPVPADKRAETVAKLATDAKALESGALQEARLN